ncbi:MAG: hypothetical protein WD871_12230 [Xanthobacteraceae bacterium]
MRPALLVSCFLALTLTLVAAPASAIKKVPYPEIRVRVLPPFKGDPALTDLRKKLADAVAAKDVAPAAALVAPGFVWTAGGVEVDEFDPKRDAVHNFKVAFGFRAFGKDADGPTEIGPQWALLDFLAKDEVLTQEPGSKFVCGSQLAKFTDAAALDEALTRVDEENELSEWVYSIDEITLTATPDGNATVAKVKGTAMPIASVHPAAPAGNAPASSPPPTHFELLLPTGKTGWTPVKYLHPLFVDRLCFTKLGDDWKIAVYDQAE